MTETAPPSPAPGPPRGAARQRRRITALAAPTAALAAAAGAFAYVGAVDPNRPGNYPVCPLLHLTGLYCPGCGGLRAAHAVVHGDLAAALSANALAVTGLAVFGVLWILWVMWCLRWVRGRSFPVPPRLLYAWLPLGAALTFTVVRNLPLGAALAP